MAAQPVIYLCIAARSREQGCGAGRNNESPTPVFVPINGVASGLYYITLDPPAGSNLGGQSAASYVGNTGLTVNWGVAPGREAVAAAMLGTTNNTSSGPSLLAFDSDHHNPPEECRSDRDFDFDLDKCCRKFPKDFRCRPRPQVSSRVRKKEDLGPMQMLAFRTWVKEGCFP